MVNQGREDGAPLILGADMNHYPGPRKIDNEFAVKAGLQRAELAKPTWLVSGSKHEWLARIGAAITGRSLEDFDGQLDAMLYGDGVEVESVETVDITSDHKAIVANFVFAHDD